MRYAFLSIYHHVGVTVILQAHNHNRETRRRGDAETRPTLDTVAAT